MDLREKKKIEIFCYYAKGDLELFLKFREHMKPLELQGLITIWSNGDIRGGMDLENEIKKHINSAQILLLFISSYFMGSDACESIMQQALERHRGGEACVIPILLRDVSWQGLPLSKLQTLPKTQEPITSKKWRDEDEAFYHVVEGVKEVVAVVKEQRYQAADTEPIRQGASPSPSELSFLPDGWVLRKQGYLERRRVQLTEEEVLYYFDGGIPDWQVALSSQIPRREMVSTLHKIIEGTYLAGLGVTVLLGGGGEGKSTILRQVICDVLFGKNAWNLIWHEDENKSLSVDFLRKLPPEKGAWLIASDNADQIAKSVFNTVRMLREDGRKDIHFFLCCRQIDWKGIGADKCQWASHSKFTEAHLRELTFNDAKLIIDAWSLYGDKGLAKLAGCSPEQATKKLLQNAQSELSKADGSFLGAMLETRYPGEALDNRVLALLTRLNDLDQEFHRELLRAYTYIVALHAENQLILARDLLAYIFSCSVSEVQQLFLGLLEREAATATRPSGATAIGGSNQYVFARHRVIAEAAVRILSKNFYRNFDDIYETLFDAAIKMFVEGGFGRVPDIRKWRSLPRYFFEKGRKDLGFRLAHLSSEREPHDPLHTTLLSRLYQEDGQFDKGAKVFRDSFEKLPEIRKDSLYYHEWATAEGKAENHAISAWLDGIALADGVPSPVRVDKYTSADRIVIALDGMSIDFEHLFQQTNDPIFQNAWVATVQLGLLLEGTQETANARKRLRQSHGRCLNIGVGNFPPPAALQYMQEGIIAAWESREVELPHKVRHGRELTFHKLNIFDENVPHTQQAVVPSKKRRHR